MAHRPRCWLLLALCACQPQAMAPPPPPSEMTDPPPVTPEPKFATVVVRDDGVAKVEKTPLAGGSRVHLHGVCPPQMTLTWDLACDGVRDCDLDLSGLTGEVAVAARCAPQVCTRDGFCSESAYPWLPSRLYDLWADDSGDFYAAGWGGLMLIRHGQDWRLSETDTHFSLYGVGGAGSERVAVGSNGTLLHLDTATGTWQHKDQTDTAFRVWGAGDKDIYATGGGRVLHWDGERWARVYEDPKAAFWRIWGSDPAHIYMAGSKQQRPLLLVGSGQTWQEIEPPGTSFDLSGVSGSGDHLFVIESDRALLDLSGGDWQRLLLPQEVSRAFAVWAEPAGGAYVLSAFNGVAHWDGQSLRTLRPDQSSVASDIPPHAIYGAADRDGARGDILLLSNRDVLRLTDRQTRPRLRAESGGFYPSRVWGSGPDDIYAPEDRLWHFDGASWSPVPGLSRYSYFGHIWGSDKDNLHVYAYSVDGPAILSWDGKAWSEVPFPYNFLACLWGSGPKDVHAIVGGRHFHYDGAALSDVGALGFRAAGCHVTGLGETVYVVGETGHISRRESGGTFQAMTTPIRGDLASVFARAADDVFAVGNGMLHYDGAAWSLWAGAPAARGRAVWGMGDDLYVVAPVSRDNNGTDGYHPYLHTLHHHDGTVWRKSDVRLEIGPYDAANLWGPRQGEVYLASAGLLHKRAR